MTEKKAKEPKHIIFNEFPDNPPSNFYIRDALGQFVFFKTKQRNKAQEYANQLYGANKYSIRVCGF